MEAMTNDCISCRIFTGATLNVDVHASLSHIINLSLIFSSGTSMNSIMDLRQSSTYIMGSRVSGRR